METTIERAPNTGSITDLLGYQRDCKRTGNFEHIGHLKKIVFEANKNSHVPGKQVTDSTGLCIDLYGKFISLAQSRDKSQLLLLGNFVVSDGARGSRVGLPDIPDPMWVPGQATDEDLTSPDWKPNRPRMIAQKLEDRTGERWKENPEFFVFHPVVQLMIHMEDPNGQLIAAGGLVECKADVQGRHVTLLISEKTGEAHFVYGMHTVRVIG